MAGFCRYCGAEIKSDAGFCQNCGRANERKEPVKMGTESPKFCRRCGKKMLSGKQFCPECGWNAGSAVSGSSGAEALQGSRVVNPNRNLWGGQNITGNRTETPLQNQYRNPVQGTAPGQSRFPNQNPNQNVYGNPNQNNAGYPNVNPYSGGYMPSGRGMTETERYMQDAAMGRRQEMIQPEKRRGSKAPLIALLLVAALFVSFVYPGFLKVKLPELPGLPEGVSDIIPYIVTERFKPGTASGNKKPAVLSEKELQEEYDSIDEAFRNGTLFDDEGEKSILHDDYNWLFGDENGWAEEREGLTVLPSGKSKAFTMETPYGITISAEENALDKDREFTLQAVDPDEYERLDKELPDAAGSAGLLVGAFEIDAGLQDSEVLPGYYTMDFDLETLGLEASDYDALRFYRVNDEGKWQEYPAILNGDKVTIEADQNSLLLVALTIGGFAVAADTYTAYAGGAYFNPYTGVFDLKYKGQKVMQVMLNRKSFLGALESGNNKLHDELDASAKEEAFQQIKEEEGLLVDSIKEMNKELNQWQKDPDFERDAVRIKKKFKKRYETILKDKEDKDPDYKRIKKNLEDYKNSELNIPEFRTELEAVEKVCISALKAWQWLKEDLHLRMPTYQFRIELSGEDKGAYGATLTPALSNPYMVISMAYLGRGDKLTYDRLLCTVCHELFHAVQRCYVSKMLATYKFDEMSAQDLECMAYDHFKEAPDDPITSKRESVLENLSDAYWFAVPLDSFKTSYPEGTLSASDSASASYPIGPFVTYLREQNDVSYPLALTRYHSLLGKRDVTTVLKEAFSVKDDEELTESYHAFAEFYQTNFYKEALKDNVNDVFSPITELNGYSGKKKVDLLNKNYTTRVRRIRPTKIDERWKQYAMVIRYDDDYKDAMSDMKLLPLKLKENEEYREYADGLFVEPRKWTSDEETIYLMEVDGGTAEASEGWIWNDYSGYTLYLMPQPEQPEVTDLGEELSVKLPLFGEWPGHEIVDSYVLTLRLGKKDLMQVQVMKKDVDLEPVKIDISDLKLDGKKLTQDQRNELTVILQECVEGTYKSGEPCLGPESDPQALTGDIFGTWEIQSEMQGYNSPMLDQYINIMGSAAGMAAGGDDAVGQIVGDSLKQYAEEYGKISGELSNSTTKGKMVIKPSEKKGEVKVAVKFEGEAPLEKYNGTYDETTMILKLQREDTNYKDSKGNVYDLSKFGLAPGMELTIYKDVNEKDPDHPIMTFEGTTAMDNQFASFNSKLSGKKISDSYEELK